MKLSLTARIRGQYLPDIFAEIEVPELYRQCFAPIDICDDRDIAFVVGGVCTEKAKIINKTREDAAEVLAQELAHLIVAEMKKHDTKNGYKE